TEGDLADQRRTSGPGRELFRTDQDPDRDGEVRPGAALRDVGRREVDRDSPRRMHEAAVPQRAPHALPRLADGCVAEPHDRETRQSGGDVDLDPNHPSLERDERGRKEGREHARNPTVRGLSTAYQTSSVAGPAG